MESLCIGAVVSDCSKPEKGDVKRQKEKYKEKEKQRNPFSEACRVHRKFKASSASRCLGENGNAAGMRSPGRAERSGEFCQAGDAKTATTDWPLAAQAVRRGGNKVTRM